jgi:hypothetical protein
LTGVDLGSQLAVTVADGRSVVVEIAHDARIRQAVQPSFGWVLDPAEVAADKTLALFGRAAARDLVDVAALAERYPLERLCALAPKRVSNVATDSVAFCPSLRCRHPYKVATGTPSISDKSVIVISRSSSLIISFLPVVAER